MSTPKVNAWAKIRSPEAAGACEMAAAAAVCGRICDIVGNLWQNHAPMELDRYDRAILRLLQQDARITNAKLASEVSLSESACLRRVRALEESGLIEGYTTLINQQKAGYPVNVFVSITLDRQSQSGLTAFETAVRRIPEVMECYLMTGEHDYLLRLVVADLADFERVHSQHLTRLPSVVSVQSSFAMRIVTRAAALPVR
jgi:Lrp/AsnC family transcriptional regulator, leucine-responsive regulatory protein